MKEIKNILKVLRSHFKIPKLFAETCLDHQQWHILSVDLNEDALKYRKVQGLHISVYGGAGDGLTYYWDHKGCSLENQYDYSFNMPEDTDKFINRVRKTLALSIHCSSFFKHNLVCTLMPCKFISFGSKRNCQGIYFSGIKFDQFLFFLEFFSYPEHIVDFIKSNNGKFGHLLYDVSFDCLLDPRKLVFSKSGFYAVF